MMLGAKGTRPSVPTAKSFREGIAADMREIVDHAEMAYGQGCYELAMLLARSGDREGLETCLWKARSCWGRSMIYLGACDGFLSVGSADDPASEKSKTTAVWLGMHAWQD